MELLLEIGEVRPGIGHAHNTLAKNKRINVRLAERDLGGIQTRESVDHLPLLDGVDREGQHKDVKGEVVAHRQGEGHLYRYK